MSANVSSSTAGIGPWNIEGCSSGGARHLTAGARSRGLHPDRGSAVLLIAVVVTVALSALGLGVLGVGLLESEAARHGLAARQAACAAEAGLEVVKHWFDAPPGSAGEWTVPSPDEADRSLRRVDPEGDGAFVPFSAAPPPWNVSYREGRDDLFERPYGGSASLSAEGEAEGPDLAIAWESGVPAQRAFLARLSAALFPDPIAPNQTLRVDRILVYGPPRVRTASGLGRMGIATVDVRAQVLRGSGGEERIVATARARGVLQEIAYAAAGPLTAGRVEEGEGLDVRWGAVLVSGDARMGADLVAATVGGWPWRSLDRRLTPDADLDGTPDDLDADGTPDLDEWLSLPDTSLDDPWIRWIVGGSLFGAPAGVKPYPFDAARIPGSFATDDDRSGLFQQVAPAIEPLDPPVLRAAAAEGAAAAHLFRYVPGSSPPLFKEVEGVPLSFEEATRGVEGLFYFDTSDGEPLRDGDSDGTMENLTPPVVVSDPGWWTAGCVFLNAASFSLGVSTRSGVTGIAPPGEPFADLDGNGACAAREPYLRLDYPPDPLASGAAFTRAAYTTGSAGTARLESGPRAPGPVTVAGVVMLPGRLEGGSTARVYGAIRVTGGIAVPKLPGAERLQILFDDRLARDGWPPASSRLPRTFWQGRSVSP